MRWILVNLGMISEPRRIAQNRSDDSAPSCNSRVSEVCRLPLLAATTAEGLASWSLTAGSMTLHGWRTCFQVEHKARGKLPPQLCLRNQPLIDWGRSFLQVPLSDSLCCPWIPSTTIFLMAAPRAKRSVSEAQPRTPPATAPLDQSSAKRRKVRKSKICAASKSASPLKPRRKQHLEESPGQDAQQESQSEIPSPGTMQDYR